MDIEKDPSIQFPNKTILTQLLTKEKINEIGQTIITSRADHIITRMREKPNIIPKLPIHQTINRCKIILTVN